MGPRRSTKTNDGKDNNMAKKKPAKKSPGKKLQLKVKDLKTKKDTKGGAAGYQLHSRYSCST